MAFRKGDIMKILLVDDHPLFLQGMQSFLQSQGIAITGMARNGPEALVKYEMVPPDLVLMDLQMAGCDGIETTRMIKKDHPAAKVIILTASEDEASLLAALQAGASGYLLKGMEPEEFLRQLNALEKGEAQVASGVAGRLLQQLIGQPAANADDSIITGRQLDIIKLLGKGLSYKEIATQVGLKEVTVKYHIYQILDKLHLYNKAQLIAYATKKGII